MTAQLRDIIQSEVCDFFAGFVEIHTELGGPNSIEEVQDLLSDRLYAALAAMDSEPVADIREDLGRLFVHIKLPTNLKAGDVLYAVPPVPVAKHINEPYADPDFDEPAPVAVPDGYCLMPQKLTAANGAKGALSGEFHIPRTVTCRECGGDGCEDCDDQGEWEEEIPIGWDIIKLIYAAAVEACALTETPAAPEQEV